MLKLAMNGGKKLRSKKFPAWPVFTNEEIKAVTSVIESGNWWRYSYGQGIDFSETKEKEIAQVVRFQEEFANHQGAEYGVGCVNGTLALDMTVRALGIGPGDEVIVPPYTFVAGVTCVLYSNAIPIFVDIDPNTYNIDPDKIEEAITDRTKAIIPCHFGGQVADMDKLQEIARKYNLIIIEDAAHAHGSEWDGKGAGTFGAAGTFSFQNSKNMTAGEGGIVLTSDAEIAEKVESLTWSGRKKGRPWYEFYQLGWNARMLEVQGALLRVQLKRLENQNAKRRENAKYLSQMFREIGGLDPIEILPKGEKCSFHIFMIRYNPKEFKDLPRARLLDAITAEGIPVYHGYTHPIYRNPMFLDKNFFGKGVPIDCDFYGKKLDYRDFKEKCPVAERACEYEAIWLEHRLLLGSKKDMEDITGAFQKVKSNLDELM